MTLLKLKNTKAKKILLSFLLVILPWLCIWFYLGVLAQPRYVSSSDIVVKQVSEVSSPNTGGLGALLGVNSTSSEDARYLKEYILSYDMLEILDKEFDLYTAYTGSGRDFVYNLDDESSQEDLLAFYRKRVKVNLDEQSYILNITTEGFTPEFAQGLNQAIIKHSEAFVNRISQNVAKDQLNFAKTQLQDAQNKLANTKQALFDYQNANEIIDPQANVQALTALIANLESNLSTLRTEERTLLSYLQPTAPQVQSIRTQIAALEKQITQEQDKLTSPNQSKLNRKAIEFETIKSDVEFATDLYKLSLTALEKARLEAVRKLKSLIIITSPKAAGEAAYPRVPYVLATSFVLLCMFYGFISMLLAIIRDHKD